MNTAQDEPIRPLNLDPGRARRPGRRPYGVVDIGSNSVRLVVYDQLGRALFPRFNEKSLCRLGAGMDQTGELAADGVRRTIEAVRRFRAVAEAMAVDRIDVVATEAVRRATNGPQLVAAIAEHSGLDVRVLAGTEEAHYAALGVIAGFYRPIGLVGDMGGGSLEVAEILDDRVGERSVSMPLGALPVQAMLAGAGNDLKTGNDAKTGSDPKRMVDRILKDALPPVLTRPVFYAVGGGWRSFARVHMVAVSAPVQVAHGYCLDATVARDFARSIWTLSDRKVALLPGVPTRRIATLRAAALVLDRVLKRLAPERVIFSALGVREGWLYEQLTPRERYLDPLIEGAQELGTMISRVPEFAPALVAWTDDLFAGETPDERRLRVAACAVSDIGWRDHPDVRATQSFRRLLQFPFIGIDHPQRVFLAAVIHARYASDAGDPALASVMELMSPSLRRRALILGRVMKLGYRLSGSVPQILGTARLRILADVVRLEVGRDARVPDSEVVADRLKLVGQAVGVSRTEVREV